MKYFKFKSNVGIKNPKLIEKQKKNEDSHKFERIQAKKDQVNNASIFSKKINHLFENSHLGLEQELTPEWIIDHLTISKYADGEGKISFFADETSLSWVELAIINLDIDYKKEDIVVGNDNEVVVSFDLSLDALKNKCPLLYRKMYLLNAMECVNQQFLQNIGAL